MEGFASSDGVRIAYERWPGERGPVVLHHGFAADHHVNWVAPGIVDRLVADGWDVVAVDARGHGRSQKPHDAAAYGDDRMAADVSALADHLGLDRFTLVGYSMGAIVSLLVAAAEPRVDRLVVGGIGGGVTLLGKGGTRAVDRSAISAALRAPSKAEAPSPAAALFRAFAESTGADLEALACVAESAQVAPIAFERITVPTLVLVGTEDAIARRPEILADAIAGARLALVPGDHLGAVVQPEFVGELAAFLAEGA